MRRQIPDLILFLHWTGICSLSSEGRWDQMVLETLSKQTHTHTELRFNERQWVVKECLFAGVNSEEDRGTDSDDNQSS